MNFTKPLWIYRRKRSEEWDEFVYFIFMKVSIVNLWWEPLLMVVRFFFSNYEINHELQHFALVPGLYLPPIERDVDHTFVVVVVVVCCPMATRRSLTVTTIAINTTISMPERTVKSHFRNIVLCWVPVVSRRKICASLLLLLGKQWHEVKTRHDPKMNCGVNSDWKKRTDRAHPTTADKPDTICLTTLSVSLMMIATSKPLVARSRISSHTHNEKPSKNDAKCSFDSRV